MSKDSFIIYKSFYKPISRLSDKQLGRLFRAIFDYHISGVVSVEDDIEMAFEFFKNQFEIDESKYQSIVKRNQENGRRGGNQREQKNDDSDNPMGATGCECNTNNPMGAYNDNDNGNDNDLKKKLSDDNSKESEFDKFWDLYGKKVGEKGKIKRKFLSLSKADRVKIFETLPAYIASTPDKQYRKHPQTYLNNRSWEDEIIQRNTTQSTPIANLGVGEFINTQGKRTYGSGKYIIPMDAPPRPSDRHYWSATKQQWLL